MCGFKLRRPHFFFRLSIGWDFRLGSPMWRVGYDKANLLQPEVAWQRLAKAIS